MLDPLPASGAIVSAVQTKRGYVAAGRDNDSGHRLKKANAPRCSVAATPLAVAAGAATDAEVLQAHGVAQLQHLGIGHARVSHVRLDRRRAVEARSGAGAAAYCLIVLPGRVAKQ